ncbi:brevican core protein isoform X3 [Herpailurus yagouaroundi]|uniref:brevican core protein isoform X3 n=1 Tax=Herpailurus yagouaroundi TaxID=1608482 RepID=UPI001AD7A75D|nr:brevican core protein isoform X3 [Puma yagouaroundi]
MRVPSSSLSMAPLFLPLLIALALAPGPTASADALEGDSSEDRAFRVRISGDAPLQGVLGGALTIPCHVHYLRPPPGRRAVLGSPRVKWTFLSGGREAEVLVARGLRVKVSEAYRFRVALPAYPASLTDVSLALGELRPNDSGIYRCEVQHGIDDSSDAVEVKVKGVVFLYREGSARYAFSFARAQEACARIGARIATPEQLYAAYLGGYEQCDAGWLSDQTVRYPIQTPREACYGDMDGFPGVRNYGVVDPDDLYDVYCYAEDLNGELFLGAPPDKLTLEEARAYCRERGAEIATTGQLYAAWDGGLDRCSPGWLADGSVRYPIVTPSQRCGGGLPGVKTLFLFPNQTGFPNKYSRFNVYCFRDSGQPSTTPEASDPASDGLEAIVTVTETLEELQLPREAVESESRGAIYSVPIVEDGGGARSPPEDPAEAPRTLLEFESQSIVPPLGSSEEEGKALEEEDEEEEEEEAEEEALWAWPSELSSPDPEASLPTEPTPEESLLHASPPPARPVLQPGASPPPDGEPEAPRPPRVLGPPTATLPTPTNGKVAYPPPPTPVGEREVGEEAGGPELSGVPRGESEETGSSEDTPALFPATRAPEGARELEAPSEENTGRTVPAGTSVRVQPVLPTDSASQGGVAVAPSSGRMVSPSLNQRISKSLMLAKTQIRRRGRRNVEGAGATSLEETVGRRRGDRVVVLEQLIHFTPNSEVIPAKFLESTPASPPPTSALTPTRRREAQWASPLAAGGMAWSEESRPGVVLPPKLRAQPCTVSLWGHLPLPGPEGVESAPSSTHAWSRAAASHPRTQRERVLRRRQETQPDNRLQAFRAACQSKRTAWRSVRRRERDGLGRGVG